MTLGEAKVYAKSAFDSEDGLSGSDIKLPPHKPRMSYKEACEYYSKKLYKYWISQLSDEIPSHKREDALKYLLGITKTGANNV